MKTLNTFLIISLAFVGLVFVAEAAHAQTIMIRGATVHTMGKDGTLENTDVLISNGKIQKIGKKKRVHEIGALGKYC